MVTIPALILAGFWAGFTFLVQYRFSKEPAVELTLSTQQLKQARLQPQDKNFYLAVTVTTKNTGTRNLTLCFEDPIDGFLSNCEADSPTPEQMTTFAKDEAEVLERHRYEILVDNDQDKIEKLKTDRSDSVSWSKEKEADFNDKLDKLQKEQSKGTLSTSPGLKRPRIPPINVSRLVYSLSAPGFTFGKPIWAELWREDKPKRWLRGAYIRAGQTEKFTTLVPVPCAGLYRIGFAVRLPPDETGLPQVLQPIASTSEFVVVEGSGGANARSSVQDNCNSDISANANEDARTSSGAPSKR